MQIWPRNTETERSSVNHIVDMINIVMFTIENYSIPRDDRVALRSHTTGASQFCTHKILGLNMTSLAYADMASEH